MLTWAIILAALSLISGALGFSTLAGAAAIVARVLFGLFLLGLLLIVFAASCGYVAWIA